MTEAQIRMLQRAAEGRRGEASVGRGQASTAKALSRLGLVLYFSDDPYTSKVAITPFGEGALAERSRDV